MISYGPGAGPRGMVITDEPWLLAPGASISTFLRPSQTPPVRKNPVVVEICDEFVPEFSVVSVTVISEPASAERGALSSDMDRSGPKMILPGYEKILLSSFVS